MSSLLDNITRKVTNAVGGEAQTLDIQKILKLLPHRYPFLLVDKVIALVPGESATALKNVTINEPFFPGHFPGRPVMPGVMVLEAMAQTAGILAMSTLGEGVADDELYYFVGIDKARFKRPVGPGDQLIMTVKILRNIRGVWRFGTEATVDGKVVCVAEMMCAKRSHAGEE